MSFKPEVFVENKWSQNGLAFATEQEALDSAKDLMWRWFAVSDARAVPSDEPVNYSYVGRTLCAAPASKET
jgi:hypothetical protein